MFSGSHVALMRASRAYFSAPDADQVARKVEDYYDTIVKAGLTEPAPAP